MGKLQLFLFNQQWVGIRIANRNSFGKTEFCSSKGNGTG